MSAFYEKLAQRVATSKSLVCVGLDSRLEKLPAEYATAETPQFAFNRWVIDNTHPVTCAYKLNTAFYEARGAAGWHDMQLTIDYLRSEHPDIVTICDAKRADIGATNEAYATAIFDTLGFDSITLNPYLGREAVLPFLERTDHGLIFLCRTSNVGSDEFQGLDVGGKPLWAVVAERISQHWNTAQNCLLVVGATYPKDLQTVREIVGDMPILVPGIGAQGGDLAATLSAGLTQNHDGLIINSARGIIFSEDPSQAAQALFDTINAYR